jgi:hypothetical protein
MTTATITYTLSPTGQKAAILAGLCGTADQSVTVASDDPAFARLLDYADIRGDGTITLKAAAEWSGDTNCTRWDRTPTVAEILDDIDARRVARVSEKQARTDAIRTATLACLAGRCTKPETRYNPTPYGYYPVTVIDRPDSTDDDVTSYPEWLAWEAELDAANAASRAVWLEERADAKRAEDDAKAARIAAERVRRESLGMVDGDDDFEFADGALTQAPCWETHKRGKNWLARICVSPSSPGGLGRDFADKAKGDSYYIIPDGWLSVGDAVEFGADYVSGGGRTTRDRWYGFVVRIDPETNDPAVPGRLVLRKTATGKSAVSGGKKLAASLATA